jgi:hypothetical protein
LEGFGHGGEVDENGGVDAPDSGKAKQPASG